MVVTAPKPIPEMTLAGREALRRRALSAVLELRSVIFESQGVMSALDGSSLDVSAQELLHDLTNVADRTRELVGGQH